MSNKDASDTNKASNNDPNLPLANPKHEAFAIALVSGRTQAQSAVAAGYSPGNARNIGSDLMKNPDVVARTGALVRESLESLDITPDFLIRQTLDTLNKCLNRAHCTRDGELYGNNIDSRGALDAIKLLMQLRGMLDTNSAQDDDSNGFLMSAAERRAKFKAILHEAGYTFE